VESGGTISATVIGSGSAGSIFIDANESVLMENGYILSEGGDGGSGGEIFINAGDLILMTDSTVTNSAIDNPGNIRIGVESTPDTPFFLIFQGNEIVAIRNGQKIPLSGGKITIDAEYILGGDNDYGGGQPDIDVPATDFVSVIAQLDIPILNIVDLLDDQCAVSAMSDRSSFVIEQSGARPSPDDYLSSGFFLPLDSNLGAQLPAYLHIESSGASSLGGC